MNIRIPRYWMFQLTGWGLFFFINLFFAITFDRFNKIFLGRFLVFVFTGIAFSHWMRYIIIRKDILGSTVQKQLMQLVAVTIVFSLLAGITDTVIVGLLDLKHKEETRRNIFYVISSNALNASFYFALWNCIYFIFHYVDKNRKQQFDTLKMEALIRELELKTIKSHINPHFIFNALNSIRALIDENPGRARNAVTGLSNILRSSMQAEKHETVSFEKELSIVKDYLALEHIRFEDRLVVEYQIDEATLSQPVPPMMLQTLVENAIKHGISKQIKGGTVRIISSFKGRFHELVIQNTGRLSGVVNEDGFGLSATRSRLYLMFGERAAFDIREVNESMVEAVIHLPLA
ncbi:MAG: histidine kinase [Chitinophagaceae bacterium]|nr:histidine kinase [Chitinophagaceae bacterium]